MNLTVKERIIYRAIKIRMKRENRQFEDILNDYAKLSDNEKVHLLKQYSKEN